MLIYGYIDSAQHYASVMKRCNDVSLMIQKAIELQEE